MEPSPESPPPLVAAMQWASRVTAIALEMALPGLGGLWLDQKLGTGFVFLLIGVVLGFSSGMLHLLRLAGEKGKRS